MDFNYDETSSELIIEIMKDFDEIWPKVLWYDPNLEGYKELIKSVYAKGMIVSFNALTAKLNKEIKTSEQMLH